MNDNHLADDTAWHARDISICCHLMVNVHDLTPTISPLVYRNGSTAQSIRHRHSPVAQWSSFGRPSSYDPNRAPFNARHNRTRSRWRQFASLQAIRLVSQLQ